jgi:alpha-glucosidase
MDKKNYMLRTTLFHFFVMCQFLWGRTDCLVTSPDGRIKISFTLLSGGIPSYQIDYMEKPIVLNSRMGFPGFNRDFEVSGTSTRCYEGEWINEFGERRLIPDKYQELTVNLKHVSGKLLQILFRAYNEGAAFCYSLPPQDTNTFVFPGELTEFRFPEETWGYEEHGTEGEYRRARISDIQPYCERPLTLEYAHGLWASLAEAANFSYPRMLLSPLEDNSNTLVTALGGNTSNTPTPNQRHDPTVTLRAGESTPWRMFVVGSRPGDLLERNYLMLNLNPPCVLPDTSWIRPGKVMRDTTLTTANSKAIIDFAAEGGLQYVHLDWKWYGSEDAQSGDATTVRAENLDLHEIIRYGREKNVGLIVYVDRRQIKKQRDVLFPLYEKWGIQGVKIGFIDVGPQKESQWITETIAKAAEHHLMLNIHDGYRATGNNRTYPNLMTVEGIRGNEHMPTPEHNCTLPFTRYIAGIGDYTICYYENRLKTTHAHQLAMAVISFSPLQWLYWYDKPDEYSGEPEIEFFRKVPTVWDETKFVHGEIGKFATIARRNGRDWYIGTINDSQPRRLKISLDFLEKDSQYTAKIYYDDLNAATKTKVGIEQKVVNSQSVIEAPLLAGGGQAIWIKPLDK